MQPEVSEPPVKMQTPAGQGSDVHKPRHELPILDHHIFHFLLHVNASENKVNQRALSRDFKQVELVLLPSQQEQVYLHELHLTSEEKKLTHLMTTSVNFEMK